MTDPASPIGLFDSGVGGLSIVDQVRRLLPSERLLYLADQAHVPYGPRPLAEVRRFSEAITQFLLDQGAKVIVVACNTASAAALGHLRATFDQVPFVGLEPAVKPAASLTETGHIGVLATPATFEGELFASVVARFAQGVQVHQRVAPGLVERIEAGDIGGAETRALLHQAVSPLLEFPIDTIVLGCTHYPFIVPLLREMISDEVRVVDPAPAIARRTQQVLDAAGLLATADLPGSVDLVSTGDPDRLAIQAGSLIGLHAKAAGAHWQQGTIHLA